MGKPDSNNLSITAGYNKMIKRFLKELLKDEYKEFLIHHEVIQSQEAQYADPDPPLNNDIVNALRSEGINDLYIHQTNALDIVRSGGNPVSITPTASGKTLTYNIPILEEFLKNDSGHAIYIFPLKALEQDQKKKLTSLTNNIPNITRLRSAVYDGDTPPAERSKIRANFPRFLLTNPEMLHLAISQFHKGWSKLLKNLRFVVIDELHTYKGIFGSNMAQLFRRLDRLCTYYGANPQYIASSATISNPVELAENLTGKKFTLVEESGAPTSKRHYVFMNPDESVYTLATKLFRLGLKLGLKTIVFTKARKITELIYQWILEAEPELEGLISAYRAGFLPEERREIESKLESGELSGVISTSALEMGIDIGTLDLCILVGYPGTISATFQRGGRVGRRSESAVVMLAQQNALDQYFMRNPRDFFGRSFESAVVDRENKFIMKKHIVCAAAELPITKNDSYYNPHNYKNIFADLEKEGSLQRSADGEKWFSVKKSPHRDVDLRASGAVYTITDSQGHIIGSVSGANVFSECHPGAIYLHRGRQFHVSNLDLENHNVTVKETDVPYYTSANSQKDTEILTVESSRDMGHVKLHFGELKVTEWMTGYEKKRLHTQERLGSFPLDLPEQSYQTVGLWIEIPRDDRDFCDSEGLNFMGGIHGIEHLMLALAPLFVLSDRGDMGGISLVEHAGVKGPAIFLYDGYPGGVGLAARLFEIFEKLMSKALTFVTKCPCEDGCPSCIYSPRCGSGNHPLDKKAVTALLEIFLGLRLQVPQVEKVIFSENNKTVESEEPPPVQRQIAVMHPKILVFDLETQLSSDDVGGWNNIHKMKLAVGVTYEVHSRKTRIYYEEDAPMLIKALEMADMVIGFNLVGFDYTVLHPYGLVDPKKIKTLDLMLEIQNVLGHRLSLQALTSATLDAEKTADGLQSVQWVKQGKMDLVTKYCQMDVELTKDLYLYGKQNSYVLYENKNRGLVRVPVKW